MPTGWQVMARDHSWQKNVVEEPNSSVRSTQAEEARLEESKPTLTCLRYRVAQKPDSSRSIGRRICRYIKRITLTRTMHNVNLAQETHGLPVGDSSPVLCRFLAGSLRTNSLAPKLAGCLVGAAVFGATLVRQGELQTIERKSLPNADERLNASSD